MNIGTPQIDIGQGGSTQQISLMDVQLLHIECELKRLGMMIEVLYKRKPWYLRLWDKLCGTLSEE